MIILYHIKTDKTVGEVLDSMSIEEEIERNVIPNFGGSKEDYSYIELPNTYRNKFFTHEWTIENGEIVFGNEKVIEEPPTEPTPLDNITDYLIDVDYRLTLVELGFV